MNEIVTEDDLMETLKIKQRPALKRYLISVGVEFNETPQGRIWTVQKALDRAVMTDPETDEQQEWSFDRASQAS